MQNQRTTETRLYL